MTELRLFSDRTMCVSGPSQAGKTTFVINLLKNRGLMFKKQIVKVKWYYGVFQPGVHSDLRQQGYIVEQGLPKTEESKVAISLFLMICLKKANHRKRSQKCLLKHHIIEELLSYS